MMNLLDNKELLRGLLHQGDQLNTIGGGVSQGRVHMQPEEGGLIIDIHVPGVSQEAFHVVVNFDHLIVFAKLKGEVSTTGETQFSDFPLFHRVFNLPFHARGKGIRARFEGKDLKIFIPFDEEEHREAREIEIQRD